MTTAPDPSGPAYDDRVAAAFRDASGAIDRSTASARKLAAGTYGSTDAAQDFSWFAAKAWEWTAEVAACVSQLAQGFAPRDNIPQVPQMGQPVEAKLHARVAGHPVALAAGAFRAIGWPTEFDLGPRAVTFQPDPPVLARGVDSFTVTVKGQLPPAAYGRTIIFEGVVVDAATGAVVSDPIRIVKPGHTS